MQTANTKKTMQAAVKKKPCPMQASHMSHLTSLPRLKRIGGQVDGIERMILEQRYCVDILMQIKAARSALQAFEAEVLRTHLEGCVREAVTAKDAAKAEKKIKELMLLLAR